jgi:hypothetical protein
MAFARLMVARQETPARRLRRCSAEELVLGKWSPVYAELILQKKKGCDVVFLRCGGAAGLW